MNISSEVSRIIQDCQQGQLELVEGQDTLSPLVFNQRETLRRINFYLASRYIDRDDDAMFWNLSNARIVHFAKNIDMDTKDFYPYGEGESNFVQSWALRKMYKEWARENSFYLTLNDISEGLATYGSIVWKREKKDGKTILKEVKLDNLYFDQSIERIKDTNIVEKHFLSPQDLWDRDDVWDNCREILEKNKDQDKIEIWEFWGYTTPDNKDVPEYNHTIGYGYGDEFIKLWEEKLEKKDCPYYDFHLGRYKGRWLRVGVVERLFKIQEAVNKFVNFNETANEISSLLLLRTQDSGLNGNVLSQAESGQIITSNDLQQVGIDNRGFNDFINQMNLYEAQADKLCLTPEIVQGEQAPSGTPFRALAVMNANSKSAFSAYKQNLGEAVAEILIEDIFPQETKKWNRKDFLLMEEDDKDVEVFDEALLRGELLKIREQGIEISDELVEEVRMKIADAVKLKGRKINLEKGFFNFKWGIKMMPTNDTIDKQAANDAMFNALQMQGTNPANAETPLFRQYLENNGISYWKLTPKQQANLQAQQGGNMPEPKKPDALLAQANSKV